MHDSILGSGPEGQRAERCGSLHLRPCGQASIYATRLHQWQFRVNSDAVAPCIASKKMTPRSSATRGQGVMSWRESTERKAPIQPPIVKFFTNRPASH